MCQCITRWAHQSCNISTSVCKYTRESMTGVELRNQVATDKCAFPLSLALVNAPDRSECQSLAQPIECVRGFKTYKRSMTKNVIVKSRRRTGQPERYNTEDLAASGVLIFPILNYKHRLLTAPVGADSLTPSFNRKRNHRPRKSVVTSDKVVVSICMNTREIERTLWPSQMVGETK